MGKRDTPTYFAVPDPDTGDMTYWYRDRRGVVQPWPPKVRGYGPTFPDFSALPRGERDERVRDFILGTMRPWRQSIEETLDAEPDTAAARFAAFQSRCCICGKDLTDAESKVLGIGPDCRRGVPSHVLESLAREMGRIHGQMVPTTEGASE